MKKRRIPLQRLVTLIVLAIFILTSAVLLFFNNREYSTLIDAQGKKALTLISDSTEHGTESLLGNVQIATLFYGDDMTRSVGSLGVDLNIIQKYAYEVVSKIQREVPQVSGIFYGDISKRFVGYVIIDDKQIQLVRKNDDTGGSMVFYSGLTMDSGVSREVESYDPTQRPWFKPVLDHPEQQWSDVYLSGDRSFPCITNAKPVLLDGKLIGVVGIEVKLKELDYYLQKTAKGGNSVIYILSSKDEVVANSTGHEFTSAGDAARQNGPLVPAHEYSDNRIRESASFIKTERMPNNEAFRIKIGNMNYFGMVTRLEKPEQLDFRIVTLVPDSDIVGTISKNQSTSLVIVALVFLTGALAASFILRKVLRPIMKVSEKAMQVTEENFGDLIEEPSAWIEESHTLIEALNKMIGTVKSSYSEIKASEMNFRSLIENSEALIFNLTPAGRIITVNRSFLEFVRSDQYEIIGENIAEAVTNPDNESVWHEQWDKMFETQSKVSFSFNAAKAAGEKRLLNVLLIPQFSEDGTITNVIGTFTDVTELLESRRKIEELLKNENERLEALIEAKTNELNETMKELMEREKMASLGSLVAGISHEINTPLGVAVSAASFLTDENRKMIQTINDGRLTREGLQAYFENADESSRIIQNNLRRAAELIASFKSISANQSAEKEEQFNFYDYLQSILLMLKHEYKNTGHRIEIDCPKDFVVFSYPGAYSQIFTNLIMNSLIHGFRETEAGEILIRVVPDDGGLSRPKSWRIEYQDNGIGISKENLKHIFDPFFTTSRGTGTKSGSGLGLNILYNLVTVKLGGTVKCKSELGKGVLFIMEIPYR